MQQPLGVVDSNRTTLEAIGAELSRAGYRPLLYRSVRLALSDLPFVRHELAAFVVVERIDVDPSALNRGLRAGHRRRRSVPVVLVSTRDLEVDEGGRFAAVVSDPRALIPAVHWLISAGAPASDMQSCIDDRVRVRLETRGENHALLRYIRERANELDEPVDVLVKEVPIGIEARVSRQQSSCRRTDPDPFLAVGNAFMDLEGRDGHGTQHAERRLEDPDDDPTKSSTNPLPAWSR